MYYTTELNAIPRGHNQRWLKLNPLDYKVKDLYAKFRTIVATVTVGVDGGTVSIDLDQLRSQYSDYDRRVQDLFIEIGDRSLQTSAVLKLNHQIARYTDAFRVGYNLAPWDISYGNSVSREQQNDLLLTRVDPAIDYAHFLKYCMVSVNGFFHLIGTDGKTGVMIKDGMRSNKFCGQNHCGILSFSKVGPLQYLPISKSMISNRPNGQPFKSGISINLAGVTSDQYVFFVIGGYLITPESQYVQRNSDSQFTLDIPNYPLLDRLYESSEFLDMADLNLRATIGNKKQHSLQDIYSDDFLEKYVTMSQSFAVVVTTPHLYCEFKKPTKIQVPGCFYTPFPPVGPLILGYGRAPEYWVTDEHGDYTVSVEDSFNRDWLFNTSNLADLISVSDTRKRDAYRLSDAYFLEIGRDY